MLQIINFEVAEAAFQALLRPLEVFFENIKKIFCSIKKILVFVFSRRFFIKKLRYCRLLQLIFVVCYRPKLRAVRYGEMTIFSYEFQEQILSTNSNFTVFFMRQNSVPKLFRVILTRFSIFRFSFLKGKRIKKHDISFKSGKN